MTERSTDWRAAAQRVADDVLLPAAADVDRADAVPAGHLDALAAAGLYGVAAPQHLGGLGFGDLATAGFVIETLAGACLATTFVWTQHHAAVTAVAHGPSEQQARWLGPLARGDVRSGVALGGLRPGAAGLVATPVADGWRLDGEVPWVTGWGLVDVVLVGARHEQDVVLLLVDASASASIAAEPLDLVAARAARTVGLRFDGHLVPADRLLGVEPHEEWTAGQVTGGTTNGFLALGVAARACALLGPSELDLDLHDVREALVAAEPEQVPAARAAASELAVRATTTLVVARGARSVLADDPAARLAREALLTLVFGSRPAIRELLLPAVRDRPRHP